MADRSDKERQQAVMTRKPHSNQTEVPDLSQDWHVKDSQPVNYGYTGSPVNVTVPEGAQGVLFAAIGGSGGDTTTRGLSPNLGGKGALAGGYVLVKHSDTLTINVGQQGQANGPAGGQGGWGLQRPAVRPVTATAAVAAGLVPSLSMDQRSRSRVAAGARAPGVRAQESTDRPSPAATVATPVPVPVTAGRAQTTTLRAVRPAEPVAALASRPEQAARPAAPPSCPTA